MFVIPEDEIAPGYLVLLKAGRRVPVDVRVINGISMAVDESLLPGILFP
ncbi:MAG: hypothetical protein JXA25_05340 [Anaerolineales bacterium]|nr:hypothetical protein [Anaerolineales bacterium]